MRYSQLAVVSGIVLLSASCIVPAGQVVAVPQSPTVRATLSGHGRAQLQGVLIWAEADSLKLHVEAIRDAVTVAVSDVATLEVYRGRKPTAGSVAKGAGIGAAAGTALGFLVGITTEAAFGGMFGGERDFSEAAATGAAYGMVEGAFTGATLGAASGEAVWLPITVHQLRELLCHCRIPDESER